MIVFPTLGVGLSIVLLTDKSVIKTGDGVEVDVLLDELGSVCEPLIVAVFA